MAKRKPEVNDKPKTVIVLCCHRGGSSAVAGVLHYLGVDMGRGNYLGANEQNPNGYFEDARIVAMNDQILKACGKNWQTTEIPNNLFDIWPKFSKAIKQLRNISGFWGWKDPRSVLTLPLYEKWVNNPHYVVVLRDPQAVAQSLSQREGWSEKQALDFTARYFHLIRRTANGLSAPKMEIQYEKLIENPEEIERLARFVGLKGSVPEGFIDAKLNHYTKPKPTAISQRSSVVETAEEPIEDADAVRESGDIL